VEVKALQVHLVELEQQVHKVHKVLKAQLVVLEGQVLLVLVVVKVLRDHKVILVNPKLAQPVPQVM
jgi:hypothetical protein